MKIVRMVGAEVVKATPIRGSSYEIVQQMLDIITKDEARRDMVLLDNTDKELVRFTNAEGRIEARLSPENLLALLSRIAQVNRLEREYNRLKREIGDESSSL